MNNDNLFRILLIDVILITFVIDSKSILSWLFGTVQIRVQSDDFGLREL